MKYFLIFVLCLSAVAQTSISGQTNISGATGTEPIVPSNQAANFFAALPLLWVDSHMCDAPGGVYDVDITLGTLTVAGLQTAVNVWGSDPDEWYRIKIPAGTLLNSSTYNSDNALISLPAKSGATKCLVIESTTPATSNQILCSHGLPGFGGTRNPGCTNDIAQLWTIRQDDNPAHTNFSAIYCGVGCNHILIRDVEATILPGSDQSVSTSKGRRPFSYEGSDHVGLERYYIHGWDPGDAGQPGGACAAWARSSTVTTSNLDLTHALVTWTAGDRFGMDFSDGVNSPGYPQGTVTISGIPHTISTHVPTTSDTSMIVDVTTGALSGVTMTMTNPATAYANGCGDDLLNGLDFNCDYCWREWGYIEKIHTWNAESHSSLQGFSAGPIKENHNWEEGGACGWFSGGAPVDTRANDTGPVNDMEVRGNYFGRDLNYRLLSAGGGHSPPMPFGCGPTFDHNAAHDTCPFNWSIKNTVELKLGIRALWDGNIIENNWAEGQDSTNPVISVRTCSGGATCGIFDASGNPRTAINNLRFSNNWVRNSAQGTGLSTRSGSPGNGGGVAQPIKNVDILNNLFSNLGDDNQFSNPGTDLFTWGGISNTFSCTMTRGQEQPNVAHAHCTRGTVTIPDGAHTTISDVNRVSNVTTIKFVDRADPILADTVSIAGVAGFTGSYTIAGVLNGSSTAKWCSGGTNARASCTVNGDCTSNSCVTSNGTYGDGISFANAGADNHLCNSTSTCNATGLVATVPSFAYSITDIDIGDAVHVLASDCSGGSNPASYAASVSGVSYAVSPTATNSLDVYYNNTGANDAGGTTCLLDNGSGFPRNVQFANNTILLPESLSINSKGSSTVWQHISNNFVHNVFAATGSNADMTCTGVAGEGTNAFSCWDLTTFNFYDNILQGRSSASWSVVPSAAAANQFPATASGLLTGVTMPTAACPTSGAPFNCPLMALPWSSNFSLANIVQLSQGVDVMALSDAMTRTTYVCPSGANCGSTGPYPD